MFLKTIKLRGADKTGGVIMKTDPFRNAHDYHAAPTSLCRNDTLFPNKNYSISLSLSLTRIRI